MKSHTWIFSCPLSCVLLYLTLYSYFHLSKHERNVMQMFFRRSGHLVHNPAQNKLGGDNKNGFLKTGVNLSYLEFLFEFVLWFLQHFAIAIRKHWLKIPFLEKVNHYWQSRDAQKCKRVLEGVNKFIKIILFSYYYKEQNWCTAFVKYSVCYSGNRLIH